MRKANDDFSVINGY
jgi:hypothetical protein